MFCHPSCIDYGEVQRQFAAVTLLSYQVAVAEHWITCCIMGSGVLRNH